MRGQLEEASGKGLQRRVTKTKTTKKQNRPYFGLDMILEAVGAPLPP